MSSEDYVLCGDCAEHPPGSVAKYDGDDECGAECHPGQACKDKAS